MPDEGARLILRPCGRRANYNLTWEEIVTLYLTLAQTLSAFRGCNERMEGFMVKAKKLAKMLAKAEKKAAKKKMAKKSKKSAKVDRSDMPPTSSFSS
jgi:hypothetical protein